jgi:hypothetical protein
MEKCDILDPHVTVILVGNPMLRFLDLSDNQIGDESVDILVEKYKEQNFKLRLLKHVLSPKGEEKLCIASRGKKITLWG